MDRNGEIERNTVIVSDFNTPLTSIGWIFQAEINKETVALNDTLDQGCQTHFHGGPQQPHGCLQRAKCNLRTV